jgi:tRNA 2-thiouridine synthesizing protein C
MSDCRYLLVLSSSAPYASQSARAAMDVALTAAAFEKVVRMVFVDAGVLQLQPGQESVHDGPKNVGKMIPALALYEVQNVYLHEDSARRFGINPATVPVTVTTIDDAKLSELVNHADQVLVF